jgi:ABC-2 type transport system permease protein
VAGVDSLPGTREQIILIAGLRWNLFRNSLRTLKGRLQAVSIGFVWIMMSGLILGGGAAMGIISYVLIRDGQEKWFPLLLWIVFLYWQFSPLLAASVTVQFDFTNLLRFPLRFGSFFILSVAYGLFDAGAVGSIFWLFCISAGVGIARPEIFPWALLVLLLFAAMNLFLARAVLNWLDRWLAQRKTREILGFLFVMVILGVQFIGPAIQHFQNQHAAPGAKWIPDLLKVARFLPPEFAASALTSGLGGHVVSSLSSLISLALYALIFLWLLHVRLVAQYRGELISETSTAARPSSPRLTGIRTKGAAKSSWNIPYVSSGVSAVFEKEIRYARRNGLMLLNLISPIFILLIMSLNIRMAHDAKGLEFLHRAGGLAFPVGVAFAVLVQMNFAFNSLAFEGAGVQFLFLSPVPFRDILAGKNLFLVAITLLESLILWIFVSYLFFAPPLAIVAATITALVYVNLTAFAVGNIFSLCFPRKFDFGAFRRKRLAGVTMAVGMAVEVALFGSCALVFFLALASGHPWMATPVFAVLAVAAVVGYNYSLKRMDKLALDHRETLTAELCRAE